ncbi:25882_t:CDS:2, partial [Racocetra persica]
SPLDIYNNVAKCPILIPTCWNVKDCSTGLNVDDNLRSVRYNGNRPIAAVRANHCISKKTGIFYFEIDILEGGNNNTVSVGVSDAYPSLNRLA